jgi:catechol 2,3-dioxygenase-like lactoylglutathione lyase family enzyme
MKIFNLHHVNITTSKLEETKDFYVQLLGLSVGPRPSFPTVGYFLYHGDDPIIHLLEDKTQRQDDLNHCNRIDHFGIMARGLDETRARLKAGNYKFKEARGVANDRIFRLFVEDPNGAVVELAFLMDNSGKQEELNPPDKWWMGCPLYA